MIRYLAELSGRRLILWCYLVWYLVVLVRYFDPSPALWLTSAGISFIVGIALLLSTTAGNKGGGSMDRWGVMRLFLMPFCVSSFSALVKGKGFILIFSPRLSEIVLALSLCVALCLIVLVVKLARRKPFKF